MLFQGGMREAGEERGEARMESQRLKAWRDPAEEGRDGERVGGEARKG